MSRVIYWSPIVRYPPSKSTSAPPPPPPPKKKKKNEVILSINPLSYKLKVIRLNLRHARTMNENIKMSKTFDCVSLVSSIFTLACEPCNMNIWSSIYSRAGVLWQLICLSSSFLFFSDNKLARNVSFLRPMHNVDITNVLAYVLHAFWLIRGKRERICSKCLTVVASDAIFVSL